MVREQVLLGGHALRLELNDDRSYRLAYGELVEYTPEIEHYPLQDLANTELYSSWINKKRPRRA